MFSCLQVNWLVDILLGAATSVCQFTVRWRMYVLPPGRFDRIANWPPLVSEATKVQVSATSHLESYSNAEILRQAGGWDDYVPLRHRARSWRASHGCARSLGSRAACLRCRSCGTWPSRPLHATPVSRKDIGTGCEESTGSVGQRHQKHLQDLPGRRRLRCSCCQSCWRALRLWTHGRALQAH